MIRRRDGKIGFRTMLRTHVSLPFALDAAAAVRAGSDITPPGYHTPWLSHPLVITPPGWLSRPRGYHPCHRRYHPPPKNTITGGDNVFKREYVSPGGVFYGGTRYGIVRSKGTAVIFFFPPRCLCSSTAPPYITKRIRYASDQVYRRRLFHPFDKTAILLLFVLD